MSDSADHEEGDRAHVEALRPEAVCGPAGERDDGGQRQRVAGRDPLDRRQRGVELRRQRVDGDVDDRHVEDRHDGTEHDHARDLQDTLVEALVRYVGCGGHGTSKVAIRH
jgi:hypothetical protein